MGRGSNLQDEVPHANKPEARWRGGQQYQEARLEVLPAEDEARLHWTLVVSMPHANERPPLQGVPRMEDAAEYSVRGSAEGDQVVEEPGGRFGIFLPMEDMYRRCSISSPQRM